jgi:hypothetical protein
VNFYEKVAQLPFQAFKVSPIMAAFRRKGEFFKAEKASFQQTHHILELQALVVPLAKFRYART